MSNWLEQLEGSWTNDLAFLSQNPSRSSCSNSNTWLTRFISAAPAAVATGGGGAAKQLLALAADVRAWTERTKRARRAGEQELSRRAEQHLNGLMDQGRSQWTDLADLGRRFKEVDQQLSDLSRQQSSKSSSLEQDWALFEAEQELEQLRRDSGLS